ncbi:MAG: class I SAM-dependent methyltransferase [Gammaproteobacteria bacterium]
MKNISIIVQASSRSWGGGGDLCMNEMQGKPAIWHTVNRLANKFKGNDITIAAPAFDKGGFDTLLTNTVAVYYDYDDSPLKRIISITEHLPNDAIVLRVDGLNFCVDTNSLEVMLQIMDEDEKRLDLIKFQDDWPPIFCGDVYRVGALRKMVQEVGGQRSSDARYHVHPKYYFLANPEKYNICRYSPQKYSDDVLKMHRVSAFSVFNERDIGDGKCHAVSAGDALSFHYKLALNYLRKQERVLDIACGLGYGTAMLADVCGEVIGADIDLTVITKASDNYRELHNARFEVADCERLHFHDNEFDAVVSFETIEHVDAHRYLSEMSRVLAPKGIFILSTPQNAIGHIPVNPWHIVEYSLENIKNLVTSYFVIDKVIGIKQGTIFFDSDPIGTNTVLICHKAA